MAESFLIPAGITGLTKTDFDFRLYLDGVSQATTSITVTEISGDYLVAGLDDGADGEFWAVTWSYLHVQGAHSWPAQDGTPTAIVLFLPATGLNLAGIGATLLLDGVSVSTAGLTLTEAVSGRDYVLTGMADAAEGSQYIFRYEYPTGVAQSYAWPQNVVTTTIVSGVGSVQGSPGAGNTRWEESGLALGREFGEDVTFSLQHSLKNASGRPISALAVKTNASIGATSVVLEISGGEVLTGSLPAGLVLTAPGETLTVSTRAEAAAFSITVSLEDPLTVELTAGDAVTVANAWSQTVPYCVVARRKIGRVPQELLGKVSARVTVPAAEVDFEIAAGTRVTMQGQTAEVLLSEARKGVYSLMVGAA